jgi:hypothetical protein
MIANSIDVQGDAGYRERKPAVRIFSRRRETSAFAVLLLREARDELRDTSRRLKMFRNWLVLLQVQSCLKRQINAPTRFRLGNLGIL